MGVHVRLRFSLTQHTHAHTHTHTHTFTHTHIQHTHTPPQVFDANFITLATRAMLGAPCKAYNISLIDIDYVAVKAPMFSFTRLRGADPTLGVEMASTGEVACFGNDVHVSACVSVCVCVCRMFLARVGEEPDDPHSRQHTHKHKHPLKRTHTHTHN